MFEGLLNIAKSPTGNLLYDVTKIKELPHIGISAKLPSPNQRGNSSNITLPQEEGGFNHSILTYEPNLLEQAGKNKFSSQLIDHMGCF